MEPPAHPSSVDLSVTASRSNSIASDSVHGPTAVFESDPSRPVLACRKFPFPLTLEDDPKQETDGLPLPYEDLLVPLAERVRVPGASGAARRRHSCRTPAALAFIRDAFWAVMGQLVHRLGPDRVLRRRLARRFAALLFAQIRRDRLEFPAEFAEFTSEVVFLLFCFSFASDLDKAFDDEFAQSISDMVHLWITGALGAKVRFNDWITTGEEHVTQLRKDRFVAWRQDSRNTPFHGTPLPLFFPKVKAKDTVEIIPPPPASGHSEPSHGRSRRRSSFVGLDGTTPVVYNLRLRRPWWFDADPYAPPKPPTPPPSESALVRSRRHACEEAEEAVIALRARTKQSVSRPSSSVMCRLHNSSLVEDLLVGEPTAASAPSLFLPPEPATPIRGSLGASLRKSRCGRGSGDRDRASTAPDSFPHRDPFVSDASDSFALRSTATTTFFLTGVSDAMEDSHVSGAPRPPRTLPPMHARLVHESAGSAVLGFSASSIVKGGPVGIDRVPSGLHANLATSFRLSANAAPGVRNRLGGPTSDSAWRTQVYGPTVDLGSRQLRERKKRTTPVVSMADEVEAVPSDEEEGVEAAGERRHRAAAVGPPSPLRSCAAKPLFDVVKAAEDEVTHIEAELRRRDAERQASAIETRRELQARFRELTRSRARVREAAALAANHRREADYHTRIHHEKVTRRKRAGLNEDGTEIR